MKTNRKKLINQRRLLDTKLAPYQTLRDSMPKDGWLKTVRTALGLTAAQLAKRTGTQAAGVLNFERREALLTATLGSLDRAAKAMNCRLAWAILPEPGYGSLSEIVEKRARKLAEQLVKTVDQTMKLEAQGVSPEAAQRQVEELAMELARNTDPRLWEIGEEEPHA